MNVQSAALLLGALGVGLLGARRSGPLPPAASPPAGTAKPAPRTSVSAGARFGCAAAAGLAVAGLLGNWPGVLGGVVTAGGVDWVLRRMEPAAVGRQRAQRASELPVVLDLLAICLRAGTPVGTAFEIVASALPGALADDLRTVAVLQRLGATPAMAWADFRDDPALAPVADAVARSADSGSRLAESFERLAADRRSELALDGESRARRAGVLAIAPLGLCFLPAFVCLGVIPLVLSIATSVVTGTTR